MGIRDKWAVHGGSAANYSGRKSFPRAIAIFFFLFNKLNLTAVPQAKQPLVITS